MLSRSCLSPASLASLNLLKSQNLPGLNTDEVANLLLNGLNDSQAPEAIAQSILNKLPSTQQSDATLKSLTSFVKGFIASEATQDNDCGPSALSEFLVTENKVELSAGLNAFEHNTKDVRVRLLDMSISGSLNGLPVGDDYQIPNELSPELILNMIQADPVTFATSMPSFSIEGSVVSNKLEASEQTDIDLDLFHAEYNDGLSASIIHIQGNHREDLDDGSAVNCSGALDLVSIGTGEFAVAPNAFNIAVPTPFGFGVSLECEYETKEITKTTQHF